MRKGAVPLQGGITTALKEMDEADVVSTFFSRTRR